MCISNSIEMIIIFHSSHEKDCRVVPLRNDEFTKEGKKKIKMKSGAIETDSPLKFAF